MTRRFSAGMNKPENYPITQRDKDEIDLCKHFINLYLAPSNKFNTEHTSYGLKHQAEDWANVCGHTGIKFDFPNHYYVSNNSFIMAMYEMGYWSKQTEEDSPNYFFMYKWKGLKFYNGWMWRIPTCRSDWEKTLNVLRKIGDR